MSSSKPFKLVSDYQPRGDQPVAIAQLTDAVNRGETRQVLLGLTGSGKTFTAACVIEKTQRPTLIIAHNKTLAAQLYNEFKELFPENAVEYFVSYYDYYQPEAYLPVSDTFIEKDSQINEAIDRLRHSATRALLGSIATETPQQVRDVPRPSWPFFLAFLALASALWWLERASLMNA